MKFADGHSDFLSRAVKTPKEKWKKLASSPEKLKKGNVIFQVYAVFVENDLFPAKNALKQIHLFRTLRLKKVYKKEDLPGEECLDPHVMLALEGLLPLDGDPELLYLFHELGVRMVSLVWSRINSFADGSTFKSPEYGTGRGLTPYGKDVLKTIEELGILLDISHLNDDGVRDVFKSFNGIVVASHSSARTLCNIERNIPDEFIKEIAERNGVVGINFSPRFLTCGNEGASIDDLLRHIEHVANVGGIEHVALGSDFDGLPSYPESLDGGDKLPVLGERLIEFFGEEDAQKICFKNWLRVVKNSLK